MEILIAFILGLIAIWIAVELSAHSFRKESKRHQKVLQDLLDRTDPDKD